jgi:hypothetical protein
MIESVMFVIQAMAMPTKTCVVCVMIVVLMHVAQLFQQQQYSHLDRVVLRNSLALKTEFQHTTHTIYHTIHEVKWIALSRLLF